MSTVMNKSTTPAAVAYRSTLKLSTAELTSELIKALGGTLVSLLAGSKDTKAAHKWARTDGSTPRTEAETRLRFAHEQWTRIRDTEGEHTARVWFIGANPWLKYDSPTQAIREDRFSEVAHAVQALLDDSFTE